MELDEGFSSVEVPQEEKDKPRKRGRVSQSKAAVLFMIESEPDEKHPDKGKDRKVGYLKMKVIPNLQSETITRKVKEYISCESHLDTDASTS